MTTSGTPATASTTVDIVVRLEVKGSPDAVAKYRAALENLAEVMVVQAEEDLWAAGYPDGELEDGTNEHVADIERAIAHAVLIEGTDELTKVDRKCTWCGLHADVCWKRRSGARCPEYRPEHDETETEETP